MKVALTLVAALALLFAACGAPQSQDSGTESAVDTAELTTVTLAVSGMT